MSESEIYHTSINIKGKTYRIDVNKNIKIKNLKVIIINAANLFNSEFKLFSGDKDYTNFDENLLFELFPIKENVINFNIQFLDEDRIKEDLNNKKLNNPNESYNLNENKYITNETKESIYLCNKSWIIKKLEKKLSEKTCDILVNGWQNKINMGYPCSITLIDNEIKINFEGSKVGAYVPAIMSGFNITGNLSIEIQFNKIYENLINFLNSENELEAGDYLISVFNTISGDLTYEEEIKLMENEAPNVKDFTFNEKTKMYSVHFILDNFSFYGYLLLDEQNRNIFWYKNWHSYLEFNRYHFYRIKDLYNAAINHSKLFR